jgi:hypothetical protein
MCLGCVDTWHLVFTLFSSHFFSECTVEIEKISKKSTNAETQVQKTFGDHGELEEFQIQVRNKEHTGQTEIVASMHY